MPTQSAPSAPSATQETNSEGSPRRAPMARNFESEKRLSPLIVPIHRLPSSSPMSAVTWSFESPSPEVYDSMRPSLTRLRPLIVPAQSAWVAASK